MQNPFSLPCVWCNKGWRGRVNFTALHLVVTLVLRRLYGLVFVPKVSCPQLSVTVNVICRLRLVTPLCQHILDSILEVLSGVLEVRVVEELSLLDDGKVVDIVGYGALDIFRLIH